MRQYTNDQGELYVDFVEYPTEAEAIRVRGDFNCADDGMTRQEFKDECDINVLLAQYEKNGTLPPLRPGSPQYLDVSEIPNLQESLQLMREAEDAFMRLPASVRREFDNNAVEFVEFATDPANIGKLREWGLAPPAEVKPITASSPEVVQAPPSPPPQSDAK